MMGLLILIGLVAFSIIVGWMFKGASMLEKIVEDSEVKEKPTYTSMSNGIVAPPLPESHYTKELEKMYLLQNPINTYIIRYKGYGHDNVFYKQHVYARTIDEAMEQGMLKGSEYCVPYSAQPLFGSGIWYY